MSNDLDRPSRIEPPKSDGKASKVVPPLPSAMPSPRQSLRTVLALLVLALICAGGWTLFRRHQTAAQSAGSTAGGRTGPGSFPVPVVPGIVAKQDVPIYLDGLGTVQAF